MRVSHTSSSWTTSVVAGLLVLTQLLNLVLRHHETYVAVLVLTSAAMTTAAVLKLRHDNCLESRLVLGLLATLSGVGVLAAVTAGLPGQGARSFSLSALTTLTLSVALVGTLVAERSWRPARVGSGSPYAS